MLATRVLSALILAPPFLYCVWIGGASLLILTLCLSILSLREYFDLLEGAGRKSQRPLGFFWVATLYLGLWLNGPSGLLAALVLVPNLFVLKYLSKPAIEGALTEMTHTFYGVLAYATPLAFLFLLGRGGQFQPPWLVLLLILVWVQDTAAYFWGLAMGRTLFQPWISPKKTWEGAILGLLTALVAAACFITLGLSRPLTLPAVLGLILVAVSAQLGDLNESLLKRNVAAKDSGNLIPGHGGVLDRFDSFTFAAPVMYYVAQWAL